MKKIGIVGSRRRNNKVDFMKVARALSKIYEKEDQLVSGGCLKGGDNFTEVIAKEKGIPITIYYPNWKENGTAAGFIRNTEIANNSDILIACVAKDRKGGTEDTIEKFCKRVNSKNFLYVAKGERLEEAMVEENVLILV
uniref:DNA recombination-mediator protein A n=1 Tax=viral metagenome TaxID=1070528 RepID=A0A6M3LJU2_9ZZZZ